MRRHLLFSISPNPSSLPRIEGPLWQYHLSALSDHPLPSIPPGEYVPEPHTPLQGPCRRPFPPVPSTYGRAPGAVFLLRFPEKRPPRNTWRWPPGDTPPPPGPYQSRRFPP